METQTSSIEKVYVIDDLLDVSPTASYPVYKSGSSINYTQYNANSVSTSSIIFNVNPPSELTVLSRRVYLETNFVVAVKGVAPNGQFIIDFGRGDSINALPAQSMMTTSQCSLNNNSVSMDMQETLCLITRTMDYKEQKEWMPCQSNNDIYAYAVDGASSINGNGLYSNSTQYLPVGNASFKINWINTQADGKGTTMVANPDGTTSQTFYMSLTTYEPLITSPWIYSSQNTSTSQAGIYGLSSLQFQFNLLQNAGKLFKSRLATNVALESSPITTTLYQVNSAKLHMELLTPHSDMVLKPLNSVPYYELKNYKTKTTLNMTKITPPTNAWDVMGNYPTSSITSDNITLNVIPDFVFAYITEDTSVLTGNCRNDKFAVIDNISINFNNTAGILSSSSQLQLYNMTRECSICQSYPEFTGLAQTASGDNGWGLVNLTGSLLGLQFGRHIPISESFLASGVLNNTSFQMTVNFHSADLKNNFVNPTLNLVFMTSGVLSLEKGVCSRYIGLLSKQDVLSISQGTEPVPAHLVRRSVGAGWFDSLKGGIKSMLPYIKTFAPVLKNLIPSGKVGDVVKGGLDMLGQGKAMGRAMGKSRFANKMY